MSLATKNSSRIKNKLIDEILVFLKPFFHKKVFKKLELHFIDDDFSSCNKDTVSGISHCTLPKTRNFKRIKKRTKYFVIIWIGTRIKFPFKWVYRKSAPPPTIRNMKEAIVSTLAHELFHVESWCLKRYLWNEEDEAEKTSHYIVKQYRKRAIKKSRKRRTNGDNI